VEWSFCIVVLHFQMSSALFIFLSIDWSQYFGLQQLMLVQRLLFCGVQVRREPAHGLPLFVALCDAGGLVSQDPVVANGSTTFRLLHI
jgi:hypothetical protein